MSESTQMLYAGSSQRYDELLGPDGSIRRHWRPLIEYIVDGGAETARRSVEMTRRLIVENGVTYNVYADPQGRDRPWQLDPLPLLVAADEWSAIEAGVQQRARLLNALLADLYGPQELIAEGVVPAELAFGHPNFLWAAHHTRPRGGSWLQLYAADLARAPDGRWWVLNDRTQTPSGLGYALENRAIVGRVLPGLLNELSVRPLTGFLNALRESLVESTEDEGTPLVVVLTPGPFNETYFEHAYLARQLGLPLVQGQDLTVRDDTVYLKTLPGLRRVHAILRRMDDDYCDPLELRPDSTLGVPGLLGAVRAGRVTLANGLGSGLLESAAWQGLPARRIALAAERAAAAAIGGDLVVWRAGRARLCGHAPGSAGREPTYPNQQFEPCFGRTLAGEERTELIRRLRGRPYAYVAQERVSLSQAPVVARRRHGAARAAHPDHARVCGGDRQRLPGHAGCPGTHRRRRRGRHRLHAARWRQQGCLGTLGLGGARAGGGGWRGHRRAARPAAAQPA